MIYQIPSLLQVLILCDMYLFGFCILCLKRKEKEESGGHKKKKMVASLRAFGFAQFLGGRNQDHHIYIYIYIYIFEVFRRLAWVWA